MLTDTQRQEYYQALIEKNKEYEGTFYVGVKTTGVFCRPTCPARKPKLENCEFYASAQEALLASFRPCLRCRPMQLPDQTSDLIQQLVDAVEKNPAKRWMERDFKALLFLSADASTIRRQFQKRFGMTFIAYARARRIGLAMQHIRSGESVINAQIDVSYDSSSGFRDAFSKIMGTPPMKAHQKINILKAAWLDTRLGPMIAIADDNALYLLEFLDRRGLEREIERLRQRTQSAIIPGKTSPIQSIEQELTAYFDGKLMTFKTPLFLLGSPFQKSVWNALCQIPYGTTKSYAEQAQAIGKPTASRAVANANGANQLAIVIPCHRIITSQGDLGGYGGGIARKKWLLQHEKAHQE